MPRRNVVTTDEIEDYLESHGVNASKLIRDLLMEYINLGTQSDAVREAEINRIEANIDALETQLEAHKTRLQELKGIESASDVEAEEELPAAVRSRLERAKDIQHEYRDPTNEAIINHASECGLSPEAFLELLQEHHPRKSEFKSVRGGLDV